MDERLDAGRRHLHAGRRALDGPRPREGRPHFEAALARYRDPALLLGEAHALRGLAEVDLVDGDVASAEARIAASIDRYDEAASAGDDRTIQEEAIGGRAHARIVVAQIRLRTGRRNDAETVLAEVARTLDRLGDLRGQVDVKLTLARCALARGAPSDAESAIREALARLERLADQPGLVRAWLFLAEVCRAERRLDAAHQATSEAMGIAAAVGDPHLLGRALTAVGALRSLEGRTEEADRAFDEALAHLDTPDAPPDALGLARLARGDLWARRGRAEAAAELASAVTSLASTSHRQGTAAGLLKLADQALTHGLAAYALAVGEAARQWWLPLEPVRGVGLALRLEVKALAELRQWPAVVTLAWVRADRAGDVQPGALEIADHYRERAPRALVDELGSLSPEERWERADRHVETVLGPLLGSLGVGFDQLGTPGATQLLVEAMATTTPPTEAVDDGDIPSPPGYAPPDSYEGP